ncbi:MAG: universal stress protein [Anaerolineae bacterium]|nr:universal stress protein [Anaerolineae bacterium]
MTTDVPRRIVCAVRGGPESRDTVTRAIDLALQHDAHLTFFRAMDAEFLAHATIGPLSVVYRELTEMAQFAMAILCDRAQRRGVAHVDSIVREGNIHRQIRQLVTEEPVDILVMGQPVRSPGSNVFKPAEFDAFIAELQAKHGTRSGLQIEVVMPMKGDT